MYLFTLKTIEKYVYYTEIKNKLLMSKRKKINMHEHDFLPYSLMGHNHSFQFSCSVMSDSLRPHELQHTRPPCGEGNGNPLQYSCLENPRDGRAWWAAVYGVTQSWTRLKQLSSSSSRRRQNKGYEKTFEEIIGKNFS